MPLFPKKTIVPSLAQPTPATDTISFSGVVRQTATIALPRAMAGDIEIAGSLTITGTTINASLSHCVQNFYVGSAGRPLFQTANDELTALISSLHKGLISGYNDGVDTTPTTAVALSFTIRLEGPWALFRYGAPVLYLDFDPNQFGSSLSAFVLTARVIIHPYTGGKARFVNRVFESALTAHSIDFGNGGVDNITLQAGTGGALSSVELRDAANNIKIKAVSSQDIQQLAAAWAAWTATALAASPTRYLLRNIASLPYPGRRVYTIFASAVTLTVFAIGPDF